MLASHCDVSFSLPPFCCFFRIPLLSSSLLPLLSSPLLCLSRYLSLLHSVSRARPPLLSFLLSSPAPQSAVFYLFLSCLRCLLPRACSTGRPPSSSSSRSLTFGCMWGDRSVKDGHWEPGCVKYPVIHTLQGPVKIPFARLWVCWGTWSSPMFSVHHL